MKPLPCEPCIRRKVEINGENFYLIIGKEFLQCTVPRENAPGQSKVRNIIERICEEVSSVRSELGGKL